MTNWQKYIEYVKDNPEGYWFKRKIYGFGWTPVRWQGWLVLVSFLVFIVWSIGDLGQESTASELRAYFIKIILSVAVLLFICYKKGEKPRWQWGPKDDKRE